MSETVIFFAPEGHAGWSRLLAAAAPEMAEHRQEVFRTIGPFADRFRQPIDDRLLVVFLAEHRQDLTDLAAIRHLLRDTPVILILPDATEATVTAGHGVGARYISYADSDFFDVAAVLAKMLGHKGDQR